MPHARFFGVEIGCFYLTELILKYIIITKSLINRLEHIITRETKVPLFFSGRSFGNFITQSFDKLFPRRTPN